jgi:tetratricopeptide (TPR) repeat protein
MATRFLHIILLAVLSLSIGSCNPSKKILAEAKAYENAGMMPQATERYEVAYYAYGNVEAHISLKRIGEQHLASLVSRARMARMSGRFEDALDLLAEAYQYSKNKTAWGLSPAEHLQNEEKEVRAEYVSDLIERATKALMDGSFEEARTLVDRAYRFDRNNAQLHFLEIMLEISPNYILGERAFQQGRFREAFDYMSRVTDIDPDFRDALKLREQAREKASFTIAYVTAATSGTEARLQSAIAGRVKQDIIALRNPFAQLLDRQNLDALIKEQQNSMDLLFDDAFAQKAGKLAGAEYIIIGELVSYENRLGSLKKTEKKGYLGTTTRSTKVKYMELDQTRTLNALFKFSIVKTETGRVFGGATIPIKLEDRVEYAQYPGDTRDLHPGEWKYGILGSSQDQVFGRKEKDAIDQRFASRTEPISFSEMELKMIEIIGAKVAEEVGKFIPEN